MKKQNYIPLNKILKRNFLSAYLYSYYANGFFIILFGLFTFTSMGQEVPSASNPPKLVNDFANALSNSEEQLLESKLLAFNDSTSNQIVVVIVPSIGPYDMNSYAVKLGREWGVGNEGKNNGIILLWAPDDRKVYIATGYGLEGALPDAYAKRIVDRIIIPYFKEGRFYDGLNEGTNAIIAYTEGEFDAEAIDSEGLPIWAVFLFLLILFLIIQSISKGGGRGNGGRRHSSVWPYATFGGHSSGGFGGAWGSGGGGGFGGFGGGSFGGGGAGGSY